MMTTYVKKLLGATLAGLLLTALSCIAREIESSNTYLIDNRASHELFYDQYDGENTTTIAIPRAQITAIDDFLDLGKNPLAADVFFSWRFRADNEDIFLTRDSAGVEIRALQLNTTATLDWQVETVRKSRSGNTYEHTLVVTDELIE
jgi:hypothetical protein